MPTARDNLNYNDTVVDGIIYVIGGWDGLDGPKNKVEAYDPIANTWSSKANMPTGRNCLNASTVNGKIYAIGGADSDDSNDVVEEYDPATDTWTGKTPMPTPRACAVSGVVDGIIYVIGGLDLASGNALPTIEAYDPAADIY